MAKKETLLNEVFEWFGNEELLKERYNIKNFRLIEDTKDKIVKFDLPTNQLKANRCTISKVRRVGKSSVYMLHITSEYFDKVKNVIVCNSKFLREDIPSMELLKSIFFKETMIGLNK